MEIQFKGANCLIVQTKKARLVIDDNLQELGLASVSSKAEIALYTSKELFKKRETTAGEAFLIDGPGEYEIGQISVKGIASRAHIDEAGQHNATIYRIAVGTTMVCVLGHIYPELSDEQLESLGMIDILILPVGGNGYTLDAQGAEQMIKKIDPKVIIPTHFEDKAINYEAPQVPLDDFIKQMAITPEIVDKIKFKNDLFPDNQVVYQLERS